MVWTGFSHSLSFSLEAQRKENISEQWDVQKLWSGKFNQNMWKMKLVRFYKHVVGCRSR